MGCHFGSAVFWCCAFGRLTNLGVVCHVGFLLDGHHGSIPLELVNDGDLFLLIERMLHLRVWTRFGLLRLRVMLMSVWFLTVG